MNPRILIFTLSILLTLFACKNESSYQLSEAFNEAQKIVDADPAKKNVRSLLDVLLTEYKTLEKGDKKGKFLLDKGIEICKKYDRHSSSVLFYMTSLKDHYNKDSSKEDIYALAQDMKSIYKTSASDVLFSNFARLYPEDARVSEAKEAVSPDFGNMEHYLKNQADKAFKREEGDKTYLKAVHDYVDACEAYALSDPNNPLTPGYLYKGSELARSVKSLNKVISIYDWILDGYPEYEKVATVHFLKGFIMENEIKKPELAKEIYEDFLKKYPKHELVDDVQFLIDNIGKSNDEILKMLGKDKK